MNWFKVSSKLGLWVSNMAGIVVMVVVEVLVVVGLVVAVYPSN